MSEYFWYYSSNNRIPIRRIRKKYNTLQYLLKSHSKLQKESLAVIVKFMHSFSIDLLISTLSLHRFALQCIFCRKKNRCGFFKFTKYHDEYYQINNLSSFESHTFEKNMIKNLADIIPLFMKQRKITWYDAIASSQHILWKM